MGYNMPKATFYLRKGDYKATLGKVCGVTLLSDPTMKVKPVFCPTTSYALSKATRKQLERFLGFWGPASFQGLSGILAPAQLTSCKSGRKNGPLNYLEGQGDLVSRIITL